MLDAAFYDLIQEAGGAVFQAMTTARAQSSEPIEPRPPILQLRAGRAESPGWFLAQALEFAPEPLTVPKLRVRDVYGSERLVGALLEIMASEQWLDRRDEEYSLTAEGRAARARLRDPLRRTLAEIQLLPQEDLAQLVSLLDRLIQASLASPTPPGTWCLAHSRNRAPADDAPLLLKLLQYVEDFNAFRDDSHMAAWQPYEQQGYLWEAFSLVCSGEARSAEEVFQHLTHRGYTRHEYAAGLAGLQERGWLESGAEPDTYRTTEAGRAVRDEVERLTDVYFYAPWSCLTEAEINRVQTLLTQLQANLPKEEGAE